MSERKLTTDSNDNTLFVTGQCNNRCLMCCQPPMKMNDVEELFQRNLRLIADAPNGLNEIGITGGEPALLGERLFELIKTIRKKLPEAIIHLLTNGRAFADAKYCERLKEEGGGKVLVGVPLHSDYCGDHDAITRVAGSYNETLLGLYNLAACDISIELRVVVNRLNYLRLPKIAEFIAKNLPFVESVPFMAMEYLGYAYKYRQQIWIEPQDCMDSLEEAVTSLSDWKMNPLLFNYPLCLLPVLLHPFACRSISDWKTRYLPCCNSCSCKAHCCGLFATSKATFKGIRPLEL